MSQAQVFCTFSEQMRRSVYSTIHALELVPASTIPRDGTGTGISPRATIVENLPYLRTIQGSQGGESNHGSMVLTAGSDQK